MARACIEGMDELVGIGAALLIAAAVLFLAMSGTLDPGTLRLDLLRAQSEATAAVSHAVALLPR